MDGGAGHTGENRVNRGGAWNNDARNVRAAYRNANDPGDRNDDLGLRLARAQGRAGWPAPDPPSRLSVGPVSGGEEERGASVLVARAEARASARWRLGFFLGVFSFFARGESCGRLALRRRSCWSGVRRAPPSSALAIAARAAARARCPGRSLEGRS